MARYTGSQRKLSRREGVDIFGEAVRKNSPEITASLAQPLGQHGKSRKRPSVYGNQLREKQKIKRVYGVLEKQFKKYYLQASKSDEITGEKLLVTLESRLDNVVFKLGIAVTRPQARNMVNSKQIRVNGKVVDISSYSVKVGDKISPANDKVTVNADFELNPVEWLEWNKSKKTGKILSLPTRDMIDQEFNEKLVVEYYSR